MNRNRRLAKQVGAVAICAAAALSGGCSAAKNDQSIQAGAPDVASTVARTNPPTGMAESLLQPSDSEFQAILDKMPAERRPALQQMRDQAKRDRMAISDAKGFRGFITVVAYDSPTAQSKGDFNPVYDANDAIVGYWGTGVGFVDVATFNASDTLDFDNIKAESGGITIRGEQPTITAPPQQP